MMLTIKMRVPNMAPDLNKAFWFCRFFKDDLLLTGLPNKSLLQIKMTGPKRATETQVNNCCKISCTIHLLMTMSIDY